MPIFSMQDSADFEKLIQIFPQGIDDLGKHVSLVDSAVISIKKMSGKFFDAKLEQMFASLAATHNMRLFLAKQMLSRKVVVPLACLENIFVVFEQELEWLCLQKITPEELKHYRVMQQVAAIKAMEYSPAHKPLDLPSEEIPEINSASEVHLEIMKTFLGKRYGEFARELEKIQMQVLV